MKTYELPGGYTLRPWRLSDAPAFYSWARDRELAASAGWTVHPDVEYSRKIIVEHFMARLYTWAICNWEDEAIGVVSLRPKRGAEGEYTLSYALSSGYRNRGITTAACRAVMGYAFCELGLKTLHLRICRDNASSIRVAEKLGFLPVNEENGWIFLTASGKYEK